MRNLKVIKTTIEVGLHKPFKFLHVTDSHVFRGDSDIWNSKDEFDIDYDGCTEDYFLKAIKYAKDNNIMIVHTGDLIDFHSQENFEFIHQVFTQDVDYIYAAGNHDFFDFRDILNGQEENAEYEKKQSAAIAPYIKNDLSFYSRVIGGVNIVTMDDSYYQISDEQTERLKAEAAKGYPILLCMHVPLYAPMLSDINSDIAYAVGAPEALLNTYSEDRKLQQTPEEATVRAIEYIKSEPLIKALITGHRHMNLEMNLDNGITQYITHGSFAGYVREVVLI